MTEIHATLTLPVTFEIFLVHQEETIILHLHHSARQRPSAMSNVNANAQASSSKRPAGNGKPNGGKGRPRHAQGPKVKSNQAKRQQADDELRDLQSRVDAFVSMARDVLWAFLGSALIRQQEPSSSINAFSKLPLSRRTLKGKLSPLKSAGRGQGTV